MKRITEQNGGGPALLATPNDIANDLRAIGEPPIALLAAPIELGATVIVDAPRDTHVIAMPATSFTAHGAVFVDQRARIEARAYELYLQRGDADGDALADWLAAEREINGPSDGPA